MPNIWDSDLERKLLLASIDPSAKPDWSVVARTMGPEFTSEGVRQKYAKLKKEALALFEGSSGGPETPKTLTPKTPRKRKAAADTPINTPKKTRTPRKKKGSDEEEPAASASTDNIAPADETKLEDTEEAEKSIKTEATDGDTETKEDA